jgi:hypothetical protein
MTALEALGIKLVDGNFVAHLDDFYKQKLIAMRFSENRHTDIRYAS